MHYEPTDTAAMARTSNLNEELGQVKKKLLLKTLFIEIIHVRICLKKYIFLP